MNFLLRRILKSFTSKFRFIKFIGAVDLHISQSSLPANNYFPSDLCEAAKKIQVKLANLTKLSTVVKIKYPFLTLFFKL